MRRREQIGFSQRIRLDWLERTAGLLLAGNDRTSIERALQCVLAPAVSVGGSAKRGNREKAITILLKVWVTVPDDLAELRDDGLDLLTRLPAEQHLPVHWGMTMAVYPFFAQIAEQVGRLLRLQGSFTPSQLQRRLRERYGERETVHRAARRAMRSMVDWGALSDIAEKGGYAAVEPMHVEERHTARWLVEVALRSSPHAVAPLRALCDSLCLFPFSMLPLTPADFTSHTRLDCGRQGLDETTLGLRSRTHC